MRDTSSRVMIAFPTAEFGRRADFNDHLGQILTLSNDAIQPVHGQSPARNRNIAIARALELGFSHILFLDDDVHPPPDVINKLISHNKDLVSGLYLMRAFPHQPILFDYADKDGRCAHYFPPDGEEGLVPVVSCGLGCVLIKTVVFEMMEKPWIRLGEIESDHWCDDTGFFMRVREKGFQIFADLSVKCEHVNTVAITPLLVDGKWSISYDTNGTGKCIMPMQRTVYVSELTATR